VPLGNADYRRSVVLGAHLFSYLKATRALTEGSLEADIMDNYAALLAHTFHREKMPVVADIMETWKVKGLP
jgi:hypothetical protein